MKKLLLASLITGATFTATADVVTFNDSSFNGTPGSEVVFDFIDFDSDIAVVTQTDDDGNGLVTGPAESFSELGSTDVVNFKLGGSLLGVDPAYEVFYKYNFSGLAETVGTTINVSFDGGDSGLYVDDDGIIGFDEVGATKVASFSTIGGGCIVSFDFGGGGCGIDLSIDFTAGFFFNQSGDDLSTTPGAKTARVSVDIREIIDFSPIYTVPGTSQEFRIRHDGSMTMNVPEPSTVAILGLGLLGLAGMRNRKS